MFQCMVVNFKERTLSGILRRACKQFPAVILTGPRQSGKTTLVRHLFGSSHGYFTLDDPLLREQAASDPKLLFERVVPPVIIDEIQYAPGLLSYIKMDIDEHRGEYGRWIITGSQAFSLMEGVTESLAGRVAVLSLLSMSQEEISGRPNSEISWIDRLRGRENDRVSDRKSAGRIEKSIFTGGFPEPALSMDMDPRLWQSSYVQTYLERDVRNLRAIGDLGDFQRFLTALAHRTTNLINYADIARDLGVSAKTIKAWISILETGGQVSVLRPFYANLGKRLVKSPKVFFLDTGILCYLLDIEAAGRTLKGMSGGPIFEAAVFGQLVRMFAHRGLRPRVSFWRTAAGHEVDFIIESGGKLVPVEAKLTATPDARHAESIERFRKLFGRKADKGLLVCLCKERFPLTKNVEAVPFGAL